MPHTVCYEACLHEIDREFFTVNPHLRKEYLRCEITFLGGANEVGASCTLIEIEEATYPSGCGHPTECQAGYTIA